MATRILAASLGASLSAGWIGAADIGGSVAVVRKLTRRSVTAPAPENGAPPIAFDIPLTEAGEKAVAHR